jgi:spermidine/putrescine-binding protein
MTNRIATLKGSVVIAVVALVGAWWMWSPRAAPAQPKSVVTVTWDELVAEQNQNALAFSAKYKDSDFRLTGNVVSVAGSNSFPDVELASPRGTQFDANFDSKSADAIAKLKPGDTIQITCSSTNGLAMQECVL